MREWDQPQAPSKNLGANSPTKMTQPAAPKLKVLFNGTRVHGVPPRICISRESY
jgi:hypothetical protein